MNRKIYLLLVSVIFVFTLAGCENEGSAEKAGKEIDKAYSKAEKEVSETLAEVKEKIEEAKK